MKNPTQIPIVDSISVFSENPADSTVDSPLTIGGVSIISDMPVGVGNVDKEKVKDEIPEEILN